MRALVTGATGFVGSAVARRLVAGGVEVRALVRAGSDRRNLEGVDCEIVTGDLTVPETLRRAVTRCEAVYHVAADYRLWVRDPDALYRTNVDGTKAVLRAAAASGARRIVYTSSVATIGFTPDGAPADEATPVTETDMIGHYKRSKFRAEEAVRRLIADERVPAVIVNPSTPFGPRDAKPTPSGRIVIDAAKGRMPVYVDTGLNVVHVDDVADGHLLALDKGRIGERYVLGGENMPLRDIVTIVAGMAGARPPLFRVPIGPLMPLAFLAELFGRLTGIEPRLTMDALRMARKRMYYASDKAKRELGYAPRPAVEALGDAVAWYRENGYLR